jgi:hypothetical protein
MNFIPQADAFRHEYRLKKWKRGLYVLLGGAMAAPVVFFALIVGDSFGRSLYLVALTPFAVLGLFVLASVLRFRLVIDGTRIEVRKILSESSADLSEIEGYRTISGRGGTYTLLYLKEGRGEIHFPEPIDTDDYYRACFQQLTDLNALDAERDARDHDVMLAEISQNAKLGSTPEERLRALKQAKALKIAALIIAIAAAIGFNFASAAYCLPLAIVVALVPISMLLLMRHSPMLYAFFKEQADPRADLGFVLAVAGIGLALSVKNFEFVSMEPLFLLAIPVALVYIAMLYGPAIKNSALATALIPVLFVSLPYSFGLAVVVNSLADTSKPTTYIVPVTGKHETHGKSTTYYLELTPWGPVEEPSKIRVSSGLYSNKQPGDSICLALHPGRLRAAWYHLAECPAEPAQEPTQ